MAALLERGCHLELVDLRLRPAAAARRAWRRRRPWTSSAITSPRITATAFATARSRCTATGTSARRSPAAARTARPWSSCPCSMKTLAGIAHGLSRNLVERAADVMLKERRTLIIVPRETPMSLPQLRNMTLCAEAGAMIMPAMPAFYQMPKTLDDLADFMAGKILRRSASRTTCIPSWKDSMSSISDFNDDRAAAPNRGHVRRDRAALRPAQPRAERRARSAVAAARRRRALPRPRRAACSISAPARRIWRSRSLNAHRDASVVGIDFSGAMLRLGLQKGRGRDELGRRIRLVRGDAARIPLARCNLRRGDDRLRHPECRRAGARARRARPRSSARRAPGDPRVRPASNSRRSARSTPGTSAICYPWWDGSSRTTRAPIRTSPLRLAPSLHRLSSPRPSNVTVLSQSEQSR